MGNPRGDDELKCTPVHPLALVGRLAGAVLHPIEVRSADKVKVDASGQTIRHRVTDITFVPNRRDEGVGVGNDDPVG